MFGRNELRGLHVGGVPIRSTNGAPSRKGCAVNGRKRLRQATNEYIPHTPKSVLRAILGRVQFTLHATRRPPHGASRLVQSMSAWLVKIQCAPSRHSRDARVYGHTTTAMHKLRTPPPIPLPPLSRMQASSPLHIGECGSTTGKALTGQLHDAPSTVSGSGHTRN